MAEEWETTVTPSGLHYEFRYDGDSGGDGETPNDVGVQAGLWVVEYQEPLGLGSTGEANARQDMATAEASACPVQEVTKDTPPSSSAASDDLRTPATALNGQASSVDPNAKRTQESPSRPASTSLWARLDVDPDHCDTNANMCGLAVKYRVQNSKPVSPLVVTQAVFVGEGVRGISIARQVGRRYMAVERCSFRPGYVCRIEFHRLDNLVEVGSPPLLSLDPGLLPDKELSQDANFDPGAFGESEDVDFDGPKDEDEETRNAGTRCKKKKKRSKRKNSSTKKASSSKKKGSSKKKTVKISGKGTSGDVVNPTDLGRTTTMTSAFRIPAGTIGLDVAVVEGTTGFLFLCASAAEPIVREVELAGHAVDDSFHFMPTPVMDAVPLTADQNIMFFVLSKLHLLATRRCCCSVWTAYPCCLSVHLDAGCDCSARRAQVRPRGMGLHTPPAGCSPRCVPGTRWLHGA